MKKDEIIQMAREAGCIGPGEGGDPDGLWEPSGCENVTELMHDFAALVAEKEREECAKEAENMNESVLALLNVTSHPKAIAAKIRARGQK